MDSAAGSEQQERKPVKGHEEKPEFVAKGQAPVIQNLSEKQQRDERTLRQGPSQDEVSRSHARRDRPQAVIRDRHP